MIRNVYLGKNGFEYETSCDWCDNTGPYYDYNGASLCEDCLWKEIDSQEDEIEFLTERYPDDIITVEMTVDDIREILEVKASKALTEAVADYVRDFIDEYYEWRGQ